MTRPSGIGGISGFSPRLDEYGNSQRTRRTFERLSTDMGLHLFQHFDHDA
ncbi:glutaminase [Glutamicibacter bergerei]|uniref:glutaminase n=1 Tax=Glutamicibacter bergerei TaxID=256702 RepID=A0ABV9MHY8_9MICC|nr:MULTISPECIES: glutaminase [unclassified Arthrobacter]HBV09961.1 hypothetical protein [Micrococcaceae bacterium]